jgi:hypothetical protein
MRSALMAVLLAGCSSGPPPDCVAFTQTAQDQVDGRLAFYRHGCAADTDCVLVQPQLACFKGCPSAVLASSMMDAVNDVMGRADSICGAGACTVNIGCTPVFAACAMGACTEQPGDAGVPDAGMIPDAGSGDGGP